MSYDPPLGIYFDDLSVQDVKEYLQSMHTTLWGQTYTVQEDDRAEIAARWFRGQMIALAGFVQAKRQIEARELADLQPSHPERYAIRESVATVEERRRAVLVNEKASKHDEELGVMLTAVFWPAPDPATQRVGPPQNLGAFQPKKTSAGDRIWTGE